MLLAEIDVPHLKDVSSQLWKRPFDSDVARFYFVDVVGMVKAFHLVPVCDGFIWQRQTVAERLC